MFLSKSTAQLNRYLAFVNGLTDNSEPADQRTVQELQELLAALILMSMATKAETLYPLHSACLESVLAYKASLGDDPAAAQLLAQAIDKLHACLEHDGFKLQSMIQEIRMPLAEAPASGGDDSGTPAQVQSLADRLAALVAHPARHVDTISEP